MLSVHLITLYMTNLVSFEKKKISAGQTITFISQDILSVGPILDNSHSYNINNLCAIRINTIMPYTSPPSLIYFHSPL